MVTAYMFLNTRILIIFLITTWFICVKILSLVQKKISFSLTWLSNHCPNFLLYLKHIAFISLFLLLTVTCTTSVTSGKFKQRTISPRSKGYYIFEMVPIFKRVCIKYEKRCFIRNTKCSVGKTFTRPYTTQKLTWSCVGRGFSRKI